METIFYRAVALSKDEISDDEKHTEIPKSSDSMFEKNPKVSELQLFFSNSWKDLVKKSRQFVSLNVTEEKVQFWADC